MKATITKSEFDALSDDFKAEYSGSDDEYKLTVDGAEDTGALKRAKDHEVARRKKAEAELTTTKSELDTRNDEIEGMRKGSIPKADADALEKSYKEKYEKREKEMQAQIDTSANSLKGLLVDNVATKMAAEISTMPTLMAREIRDRLTTEEVDGKTVTRVLDAKGQPSALTLEELQKEIVDTEGFAGILIGSKASGGGAHGKKSDGSAKKFGEMSEAERVALYKSNPDDYRKLRDAG